MVYDAWIPRGEELLRILVFQIENRVMTQCIQGCLPYELHATGSESGPVFEALGVFSGNFEGGTLARDTSAKGFFGAALNSLTSVQFASAAHTPRAPHPTAPHRAPC